MHDKKSKEISGIKVSLNTEDMHSVSIPKDQGGYSEGDPPLPIPNREVKPFSADGTANRWESKSPPVFFLFLSTKRDQENKQNQHIKNSSQQCGLFLCTNPIFMEYNSLLSDVKPEMV